MNEPRAYTKEADHKRLKREIMEVSEQIDKYNIVSKLTVEERDKLDINIPKPKIRVS